MKRMPSIGTASPTPGTGPSSGPGDAAGLSVSDLTAGYGGPPAVREISFTVDPGTFLTILGPSGCGKSTILKAIGGYLAPQSGRVLIGGHDATNEPPERRQLGMVFQNYALFPHLSAWKNVSFGLEVRRLNRSDIQRRTQAALERVGLTAAEWHRKSSDLSGGQQQRVALARALVTEPRALLLDEPFANLDRHLRIQLRAELNAIQRNTGVTTIMVTHDQEEALAASDHIAIVVDGKLIQWGTPEEVYRRPRSAFVAGFLGEANLLDGPHVGRPHGQCCLVRPEQCTLGDEALSCRWHWDAVVIRTAYYGSESRIELACENGPVLRVRSPAALLPPSARMAVGFADDAVWVVPNGEPS